MIAADLRVFADAGGLATAAARDVAQVLATAAREHGSASIALAGGRTPRGRLTLTLPALTHARAMFVVVAGSSKADALHCALGDRMDPDCPASLIRTGCAPVVWWADAEAAAHLSLRSPR